MCGMDKFPISIRKAKESDLMFYFSLRNEESVRQASFNSDKIDFKIHSNWFLNKIKDPNCYLFVAVKNDKPIGQIRIDISGKAGETNISLFPEGRGKGYAQIIIKEASDVVFKNVPEVEFLAAHIKLDNIASIKSFKRAGFLEKGMVGYKGTKCAEFILSRSFNDK